MEKKCSECKEFRDVSKYNKDLSRKDGLYFRCVDCIKKKRKEKEEMIARGITLSVYGGNEKWKSLELPKQKCPCDYQSYLWQRANPCTHNKVLDAVSI